MITPPFGSRANDLMVRSISLASRTPAGANCTPTVGATCFEDPKAPGPGRIHRTINDRYSAYGRRDLFEHLEPFSGQCGLGAGKPSDIAARARPTRNDAYSNRIGHIREHDRYGGGRIPQYQHDLTRRCENGFRCAID